MKTSFFFGLCAVVSISSGRALADDKASCLDAASRGQTLRDAHKLIEARDKFRACAQRQCPAVVQHDCASWLEAVEKSIATVVVTAKDGAGADLLDVTVRVDGQPLIARLDGEAVAMDPGLHAFHFELADGTSLDQKVLVKEGERNQSVAVILKRATEPQPVPVSSGVATAGGSATPVAPADRAPPPGSGAWKTTGWVLGGVGIVGIGVGAIFGLVAISDKHSAHCNSDNFCDPDPLHSARNAATVSDVGFIGGGVLLAAGLALVVLSPGGGHEKAAGVAVAPMVATGGGGLSLQGGF